MTKLFPDQPTLAITASVTDAINAYNLVTPRLDITLRNDGPVPLAGISVNVTDDSTGWDLTSTWNGATSGLLLIPGASLTLSREITFTQPGFYEIKCSATSSSTGMHPVVVAKTVAKTLQYTTLVPAGAAWVDYATVWASAEPGQNVKTSYVLSNYTPYPATIPIIAMLPYHCSAMSVELSHDGSHAVTSQLTRSSELNHWIAGGPIVDSLYLPANSVARYDFTYTFSRGLDYFFYPGGPTSGIPTTIDLSVSIAGKTYTTPSYVKKDLMQEPRGSMNPQRIMEMLFGVEVNAAEQMLGSIGYDFLNGGGTIWHLIADLVARRGAPDWWTPAASPIGDNVPDWVDPRAFENPHPYVAP